MRVVRFRIDAHEVTDELQRLQGHPRRSLIALEQALSEMFEMTQEDVHVITGSLRGSGVSESDWNGTLDRWEGTITYGGGAPGFPYSPVNYAYYEWRRGDLHDFFRSTPLFNTQLEDAVEEHFHGDR